MKPVKKLLPAVLPCLMLAFAVYFSGVWAGAAVPTTATTDTTYYFSSDGSTDNDGLTPEAPFPVSAINTIVFQPGDSLLIRCGDTYTGTLHPQGSGTSGSPITLGSYTLADGSTVRPVVNGGTATDGTITLYNQQYWVIEGLEVTGGTRGIYVYTNTSASGSYNSITIRDCVVHDMNGSMTSSSEKDKACISVTSGNGSSTGYFSDVLIEDCVTYSNSAWGGIFVGGYCSSDMTVTAKAKNVTVQNCTAYDLEGDGILVITAEDVLIDHCVAYDVGKAATDTYGTINGIWTWYTIDATVQYCEAYNVHSPAQDGGGFDIDYLSTNTIVQYCYAHDNDGYGISVFGAADAATTNSIIRYNVFSNNCRSADVETYGYGEIVLSTWEGGTLDGVQIYNNTIYANPDNLNAVFIDVQASYSGSNENFFKNNIIYANIAAMINVKSGHMVLDNNLYYNTSSTSGAVSFRYGYVAYASLSAYQAATGQDTNSLSADPLLNSPTYSGIGISTTAFTLKSGSPAIGSGTAVSDSGSYDFFGNSLAGLSSYNIGADEGTGTSAGTETVGVTALTLSKSTLSLDIGGNKTLKAMLTPDDATNSTVLWTTSDSAVATVDSAGTVTGVAAGTAVITATSAGNSAVSASCTVTVARVTAITDPVVNYDYMVDHSDGWMYAGGHLVPYFVGTAVETQYITYRLTSSNTFTVQMGYYYWGKLYSSGYVSTSTWKFNTSKYTTFINNVKGTSTFTFHFYAYVSPDGATWTKVSLTGSAVYDDGTYLYVNFTPSASLPAGTNYIRFDFYDNDEGWSTMPVSVSITAATITLNSSNLNLDVGSGSQLTSTVTPSTVTAAVTWNSSDTSVATVSSAGYVTAVGEGEATITASVTGYDYLKATANVTVSRIATTITTEPTAAVIPVIGKLSSVELTGGAGSVPGAFSWTEPDTLVTQTGEYEVTFTPTDAITYLPSTCMVTVEVTQEVTDSGTGILLDMSQVSLPEGVMAVSLQFADVPESGAPFTLAAGLIEDASYVYDLGSLVVYNLSLLDQNGDEITGFTGSVTVKIPIPEGWSGNLHVYWYDEDSGTITDMNAAQQDGYLVFETTHFSYYAAAELEEASYYTASLDQDGSLLAGETAYVDVDFGAVGYDHYNAFDVTISYDSNKLAFDEASSTGLTGLTVTEGSGTVRIQGYGEDRDLGTAFTLAFTAKDAGEAEVAIDSAKIDEAEGAISADAPEAILVADFSVTVSITGYPVSLSGDFTGTDAVNAGEDYTFTAKDLNYTYEITATMGGSSVTPTDNGDGSYTIENVTGSLVITDVKTAKSHSVTVSGSAASDVTAASTATYATDYSFTVAKDPNYAYEITITIGGASYTGYSALEGTYTIPGADITGDIEITAVKILTTVSVSFGGTGAGDASGAATASVGEDYTFTVTKAGGYDYEITAAVGGTEVSVTDNGDGTYTIAGADVTGSILVNVDKTAQWTLKATEYVQLDGQSIFLITVSGTPEAGTVFTYDGSVMYWSEKYDAYCWLLISADSLENVSETASGAISVATATAESVSYDFDVNGTGRVDINDAQLVYDMYNVGYSDFTQVSMLKFLRADVNGSKGLNVEDARMIVGNIL